MKKGFTLVEIMIVVAIVIVLVTLAIPNILSSRRVANEGAAIANLRTINNSCQLYNIDKETFPDTLEEISPDYLEPDLASGHKQGYEFDYVLIDQDHFTVNANSTSTGLLKGKYYFMDESGVIRWNTSGPAGAGDEIVK